MTDAILVLNCGSSSIKFAVMKASDQSLMLSGLAECLNAADARITVKFQGEKNVTDTPNANHTEALLSIVATLKQYDHITIVAVGHRVVHGGERFATSCLIDAEVQAGIEACVVLAPLHNPAHLDGIRAAQKVYADLPQVAVFDTAFHQSLPETSYLYAIPYAYYRDYSLRRYGFHGTSYRYIHKHISEDAEKKFAKKLIVAHLGNGASVCAINDGKSVATSMGLTPLDGLVQGTRSGSIDPAIVAFVVEHTQQSVEEVTDVLWKGSGLLGLSETSNDCRVIEEKAGSGDENCQRALNVFVARLQETIGSYAAVMNGVDALVFTGGIGENSSMIRQATLSQLSYLGFELDNAVNEVSVRGQSGNIASTSSKPVWVIPTDEESMIALDVANLTQ